MLRHATYYGAGRPPDPDARGGCTVKPSISGPESRTASAVGVLEERAPPVALRSLDRAAEGGLERIRRDPLKRTPGHQGLQGGPVAPLRTKTEQQEGGRARQSSARDAEHLNPPEPAPAGHQYPGVYSPRIRRRAAPCEGLSAPGRGGHPSGRRLARFRPRASPRVALHDAQSAPIAAHGQSHVITSRPSQIQGGRLLPPGANGTTTTQGAG